MTGLTQAVNFSINPLIYFCFNKRIRKRFNHVACEIRYRLFHAKATTTDVVHLQRNVGATNK